jgi:hypothetical protein
MTARPKLCVIACPSLRPELDQAAAETGAGISIRHLEMALHNRSAEALREALQDAIDATTACDAIAIGYGLCNRGIVGIAARDIPLVLPRAHDCIGLLLGSTARYLDELDREPGTYFQSAGWLKAAQDADEKDGQEEFTFGPNSNASFERLAARFGDEAARYLIQELEGFTKHYKRLAYVTTPAAESSALASEARSIAGKRGLAYHALVGDTGWLSRLVSGNWSDEEFLIVRPGQQVRLASGDRLIEAA